MTLGRAGAEIEFDCAGKPATAYLSVPASGRGRGVLVAHEAPGLVDAVRDACDRLARAGFVALAPDLFGGAKPGDPAAASRQVEALDREALGALLDRAVVELLSCHATDGAQVGALGFGLGGALALLLASRNRRVGAVVDVCGSAPPALAPDLSRLDAAVLGIFAERDEAVPPEALERLRADLEAAGARASLSVWPGIGPGFMDAARADVFDAESAARGWDELVAFLRAELP